MADKKFLTVGDFNTRYSNTVNGFTSYTKKNSNYFVTNEEWYDIYKTSGSGDINMSDFNNKKFSTDFPQWVSKITPVKCMINFLVGGTGLTCLMNTHRDHNITSKNLYGCLAVTDKSNVTWYMHFSFSEQIEPGVYLNFSEYVNALHTLSSYYITEPITIDDLKTKGQENINWIVLDSDNGLCLFKDLTLFENKPKFVCNK